MMDLNNLTPEQQQNVIYAEMDPENPDVFLCESMCPQCEKNGQTRLMLTKLNQHRETIVSSFTCPHCNYTNNDIQSGAEIESKGIKFKLDVTVSEDLNRQIIKTRAAELHVPEIDFTIPAQTQEGLTTTIEGILSRCVVQLSHEQPIRKHMAPEDYEAIEAFIQKVQELQSGAVEEGTNKLVKPFTVILEDPSGLSNIEPLAQYNTIAEDPAVYVTTFERSQQQMESMGFFKEQTAMADIPKERRPEIAVTDEQMLDAGEFLDAECPTCGFEQAKQRFCEIDIPGFRRCLIMAFVCDRCGFKDSEIKPSGDIGDHGKRWLLTVREPADLNRDILKSDYAKVVFRDLRDVPEDRVIPPVDLEPGTLGSLFTTVEGLCTKAGETLESSMPFHGDSSQEGNERSHIWKRTVDGLKNYGSGMKNPDGSVMFPFTLEIIDIVDHSFVGERQADFIGERGRTQYRAGHDDPQLHVETFSRTAEQNDELGITELLKEENTKLD